MSTFTDILDAQFADPTQNEEYGILQKLKILHPTSYHVPVAQCGFTLSDFLQDQQIPFDVIPTAQRVVPKHELYEWDQNEEALASRLHSGVVKFTYKGTEFLVYKATWTRDYSTTSLYDIVFGSTTSASSTDEPGKQLVKDVFVWSNQLRESIWVFQHGYWKKDEALYKAIASSSWDDIVLEDDFLDGLRRDTSTFFSSKSIYDSLGITWKRGLLLLGPPGNGKTECIKNLLRESGHPALYVKSFTTDDGAEYGVRKIFEHARTHSPCVLIIEDLDSMVVPEVRAFFLNELDGIVQNKGIITLATTNHPERIDDAIINRPSRFDVKYTFNLPTHALRKSYVLKWICKAQGINLLGANCKIVFEGAVDEVAGDVAGKTEGWSFAFLKELFVSFLLRIAHDKSRSIHPPNAASLNATHVDHIVANPILLKQIEELSIQIERVKAIEKKEKEDEKDEDEEAAV